METVTQLIERKADLNVKNQTLGATALHMAVVNDRRDVVSLLISHNALLNDKTLKGNTPLLVAAKHDMLFIIPTLLEAGANAELTDIQGRTPEQATKSSVIKTLFTQHRKKNQVRTGEDATKGSLDQENISIPSESKGLGEQEQDLKQVTHYAQENSESEIDENVNVKETKDIDASDQSQSRADETTSEDVPVQVIAGTNSEVNDSEPAQPAQVKQASSEGDSCSEKVDLEATQTSDVPSVTPSEDDNL